MARKVLMLFAPAVLLALLAACGAAPVAPAPTAPSVPPTAPAAPAAPAATEAPTAAPAAPAATASLAAAAPAVATRVFQIVPEQTEASYAVQETLLQQNLPAEAIGKTSVISGEFRFSADGKPTGEVTRISVDISTLKSDSDRRDNAVRNRWLESARFPLAEFTSTAVEGVPDSYTEGEEVSFKLIGDMKIRDVTRQVTWDVTGKLEGDTVTGTATTEIMMKDFGFDPPNVAGIVAVKDGVKVTVSFTAKEKSATQ